VKKKVLLKKITPNSGIIESLKEMAQIKHEEVLLQTLTERNISVYFAIYYDAIKELLEAYCLQNGFKVLNHVCLGEQVRALDDTFDFTIFDRVRYVRNGINYYGKQVSLEQGTELLKKMQNLYKWILSKIES